AEVGIRDFHVTGVQTCALPIYLWRRGSDLRAWLFTIMHNIHVNQVRARARQQQEALDEAGPEAAPAGEPDWAEIRAVDDALARPDRKRGGQGKKGELGGGRAQQ